MKVTQLYESLRGGRLIDGELWLPGFGPADYEELWEYLMESYVIPTLKGRDYYAWLGVQAVRYHKQRYHLTRWDTSDAYDPLTRNRPEELTTRQQLAIIKYAITRRRYSGYS